MGSQVKKKLRIYGDEEDKISSLPDELIHHILSFTDAKEAVQTSVLSNRWKSLWITLPFLNFGEYRYSSPKNNTKFIRHVLSKRNRQSDLFELNFCVYNKGLRRCLIANVVEYAISHNVQSLDFGLLYKHQPFKLSTFNSNSLKKLTLRVRLEEFAMELGCWDLPCLTTLFLKYPDFDLTKGNQISDSWFTCLPSLRDLGLENWDLSISSFSFSIPDLTTLRLSNCILPKMVLDLPSLITLDLHNVNLPYDMSDMISTLISLQNLTISSPFTQDHVISCPRPLLNLNIRTSSSRYDSGSGYIIVFAPKICNFTSYGIFATTFGVPELETVNIRLQGWFQGLQSSKEEIYHRLTNMFPGLGNAKTLTFDLESIKALNEISSLLVWLPSPFYNMKYIKVPKTYKKSNMSGALRNYLLGGSPRSTIVTTLPQNEIRLI
uniref:F-box domain-containing protein n=1 Tax=Daucus carota subsp. sativus TaxID=79200 RepID=A0A175YG98_DAUCS